MVRLLALGVWLAVTQSSAARAQEPPCPQQPALQRAARRLVVLARHPSPGELERAVRRAGSDAPQVRALWLPAGQERSVRRWLRRAEKRADAPLSCGDARGPKGRLLVVSARAGALYLKDGSPVRVTGWLVPSFDDAQLVIAEADGRLTRMALSRASLRHGTALPAELVRPAKVQLLARGPRGPRPVAQRWLLSPGGQLDASGPERAGFAEPSMSRLNALRAARSSGALRSNRLLRAAAHAHASTVCNRRLVAHEVVPGGDPEARVREVGLRARLVGEAIAYTDPKRDPLEALLDSPSHRMTLVDRRFTDAGIGTAERSDGHKRCTVILLAAWPRYVGTSNY